MPPSRIGKWQQIQDAQVEADVAGQSKLRQPILGLRRFAGHARDSHRTGELRIETLCVKSLCSTSTDEDGILAAEIVGTRPTAFANGIGSLAWDRSHTQFRLKPSLHRRIRAWRDAPPAAPCAVAQHARARWAFPARPACRQAADSRCGRRGRPRTEWRLRRAGRPGPRAFPAPLPGHRWGRQILGQQTGVAQVKSSSFAVGGHASSVRSRVLPPRSTVTGTVWPAFSLARS